MTLPVPAIYDVTVRHLRSAPVVHEVATRSLLWLVDLDELPELPRLLRPLVRFRAADHVGDPGRTLRQNLDRLLAEHGVDLAGGRILMLTSPRALGGVFNPLSVFWCYGSDGSLAAVVAEVHNTYRGRHAYVLHPDERGRAVAAKQFYVSPFLPVDGHYRLSLPPPDEQLAVVITLHQPDSAPFVASMRGQRHPVNARELLRLQLRHPIANRLTLMRIRRHGIALWLRQVPITPRPATAARYTSSAAERPLASAMIRRSEEAS